MKDIQSQTIDWLRFPLILLVLFVHSHPMESPQYLDVNHLLDGTFGQISYTCFVIFFNTLGYAAVPVFFLISGFLFFRNCESFSTSFYWDKLKKRFWTLLVPYILWNLFGALNVYIMSLLGYEKGGMFNPDQIPFLGFLWDSKMLMIGNTPVYYPADVPLWYVRDLIILCVLSPLFYYFIRKMKWIALALLFIYYECCPFPSLTGLSSQAIFYFSLGAFFSLNKINLVEWSGRFGFCWIIASVVLLFLMNIYGEAYVGGLFYPCCVIAFFVVGAFFVSKGKLNMPPLLLQSGFFVYAFHVLTIGQTHILQLCLNVIGCLLDKETTLGSFLYYCGGTLLAAFACVLIYFLMKRFMPRVLMLLTGGR
ncbi:MAG TPA: acyltransferase [Paludibacteraceae bacterium]|nr:acyltransferase [Paludibacteraceae bacterium]HPH63890.1 acyltransferase [Paludibacteraceae bacterium]